MLDSKIPRQAPMDSKGIRRLYLPLRPQRRFSSGRKTPAKFVGPSTGLRRLIVSRFKCGDGERYRSSLSIWGCFGWSFSDIFLRASEWLFINFNIQKSILVICQELFEEDFDMFFRKKGNFNRPSVYFTYNRMSVRLNIIFGVQLFAGVQLVFDQQSKNESY